MDPVEHVWRIVHQYHTVLKSVQLNVLLIIHAEKALNNALQ